MFLTLTVDTGEGFQSITFEGTPKQIQSQANGFIAGGIYVKSIILIGES